MKLESQLDKTTLHDKTKPATECTNCLREMYFGDEVYIFHNLSQSYMLCDQCGPEEILDRYEPQHKETLTEYHI